MGQMEDFIKERQEEFAASQEAENQTEETQNEETQVEETQTEEVQTEEENRVEDPQTEEVEEEGHEPEQTEGFNDEQLNTFFGTTGQTTEDIKSTFARGAKYSELESKNEEVSRELETLKEQNAELKKSLNPLNYFSSEEAYVAEQLRKKYPDMDPVSVQKAITGDLSSMSDIDVLALQDAIKHPGAAGGEAMSKKIIAKRYDVDLSEPVDQWDELARAEIQRAAMEARQSLSGFRSEVEIPAVKSEEDVQAERAQRLETLQKSWEPFVAELTSFDKITIPGQEEGQSFEFEVPQSYRDDLGEYFNAMITNGELEPDEETIGYLMQEREKDFIYENLDKILAARDSDMRSRMTEQTDKELNNNDPANTQTQPSKTEGVSGTEEFLGRQPGVFRS